jgi:hypothetical protein
MDEKGWPPDYSRFDRLVAKLIGSTLGTVAFLALLWWFAASVLGDYRDWTGWQRFWFVTACVIAMLVGHSIAETADRAEKLQGENLMLKHANNSLRTEIDQLKAGGS